jgi:hypothetical protein
VAAEEERARVQTEALALRDERIRLLGEQAASLEKIIALEREKVAILEKDVERLRAERDTARGRLWLFAVGGAVVGALAAILADND